MGYFQSLKRMIFIIKFDRKLDKLSSNYCKCDNNERNKKRATHRAALKFYVTKVSSLKIKED